VENKKHSNQKSAAHSAVLNSKGKKSDKNIRSFPKDEFRKYKVNGHPSYIYKLEGKDYKFIGITHSNATQGVGNIEFDKNPDPEDKRKSYFKPISEKAKTTKFKKPIKNWKLSSEDRNKIKNYTK